MSYRRQNIVDVRLAGRSRRNTDSLDSLQPRRGPLRQLRERRGGSWVRPMLDVSVPVAKSNVPPYIVSVGGRRVRRDKRPRNDWQVRPTHSRRAATANAAPGPGRL